MPTTTPWFHSLGALLALGLLAGLSACGPAPSDQAPSRESHASLGGPSESPPVSQNSPSSPHDPVPLAASPSPLASGRSPGGPSEARPAEPLGVPAWMANDLDSPDVRVRLQALDRWGQQAPTGAVDPLLLALEDEDEGVQARALELIDQDWVRAQSAKAEAEP